MIADGRAIIAAVALAAVGVIGTPAQASTPTPHLHGVVKLAVTRPCAYEDSANCYWDAGNFGNGQGHSFYSIRVGNRDCVVYMNRRYNRHHGQCYPR